MGEVMSDENGMFARYFSPFRFVDFERRKRKFPSLFLLFFLRRQSQQWNTQFGGGLLTLSLSLSLMETKKKKKEKDHIFSTPESPSKMAWGLHVHVEKLALVAPLLFF
jgi:hypothetical protein